MSSKLCKSRAIALLLPAIVLAAASIGAQPQRYEDVTDVADSLSITPAIPFSVAALDARDGRIDGLAIVGGDARVESISAASILAKTARDRMMLAMHQLYPEYDKLLRASMIKEVHLFFDELLKNDLVDIAIGLSDTFLPIFRQVIDVADEIVILFGDDFDTIESIHISDDNVAGSTRSAHRYIYHWLHDYFLKN